MNLPYDMSWQEFEDFCEEYHDILIPLLIADDPTVVGAIVENQMDPEVREYLGMEEL